MSDLEKWAETPKDKIYEIAKVWAQLYTTENLRSFQERYNKIQDDNDIPDIDYIGLQNMRQCATFAISIREFGE